MGLRTTTSVQSGQKNLNVLSLPILAHFGTNTNGRITLPYVNLLPINAEGPECIFRRASTERPISVSTHIIWISHTSPTS